MKRILIAALVGLQSVAYGSELINSIYPQNQPTNGLSIVYQGQQYSPELQLSGNNTNIDRSSVEKLITSLFVAQKAGDNQMYAALHAPDEPAPTSSISGDSAATNMAIKARLDYGTYSIVTVRAQGPGYDLALPFVVKSVGTNYYLTESLNSDRVIELIQDSYYQTNLVHTSSVNPQDLSGFIRSTNYVNGNSANVPPLIVQVNGKVFAPPIAINSAITTTNQDLSTPESACNAVFSAIATTNAAWYTDLVCSNELDSVANGTSVRQFVTKNIGGSSSAIKGTNPKITKRVNWGDYAIVMISYESGKTDWLVFKNTATGWRLSDEINHGNVVQTYLIGKHGINDTGSPKVLPVP
jgi:hypothetical protein